jgi:Na+/H+ antiporter NhaD/arsenite permease-like protein
MTQLVVLAFVVTYLGMALGRVPGLRIDRAGIAMVVAVGLVALGAVPVDGVADAIHFPTLLLLGGLMIISARVGASGFYDAASVWIARQAGRPLLLLALTIAVGGALSAYLVNDIVVFAMTPLLCRGLAARKLDPRPFLFGLAAASNAGSAATLIGNPQNILIGQVGQLDFWGYFADALVPSLAALAISFACIAFLWRGSLTAPATDSPPDAIDFHRGQAGVCGFAVVALLVLFATPMPRELSALPA